MEVCSFGLELCFFWKNVAIWIFFDFNAGPVCCVIHQTSLKNSRIIFIRELHKPPFGGVSGCGVSGCDALALELITHRNALRAR